jgi:hypothetical protein
MNFIRKRYFTHRKTFTKMKYPELANVTFNLPQLPERPQLPKLVPIPSLPIPNTAAEEAALKELKDFQAFKTQLYMTRLEKIRIEKAKKDAFSKILVPQAAASDLSKTIQKRPDLTEFDTIGSSKNDVNTINNDFNILKEIMGGVENVKVTPKPYNPNALPPPTDMKNLGSILSIGSSLQSFNGSWQRPQQQVGNPSSMSTSPQSSVLSFGSPSKHQSPQRGLDVPPPVVRNISPALKQKLYPGREGSNEKFESLTQMGFKPETVTKALEMFSDEQEILDFLVLLQDLDEGYVARIVKTDDKEVLNKHLAEFRDLAEMGFGNTRVSKVLLSTGLDKAQALEKLLSQ